MCAILHKHNIQIRTLALISDSHTHTHAESLFYLRKWEHTKGERIRIYVILVCLWKYILLVRLIKIIALTSGRVREREIVSAHIQKSLKWLSTSLSLSLSLPAHIYMAAKIVLQSKWQVNNGANGTQHSKHASIKQIKTTGELLSWKLFSDLCVCGCLLKHTDSREYSLPKWIQVKCVFEHSLFLCLSSVVCETSSKRRARWAGKRKHERAFKYQVVIIHL